MSNARARMYLEQLGFAVQEEPDWVTDGQVPDFYCSGKLGIWVEVKTAEFPKELDHLRYAFKELKRRIDPEFGSGLVRAFVRVDIDGSDYKMAVRLLRRELKQRRDSRNPNTFAVVIPDDPVYNSIVRISFRSKNHGKVEIIGLKSATGKYGYPYGFGPVRYDETVALSSNASASMRTARFYDVFYQVNEYRLCLVVDWSNKPLRMQSVTSAGGARRSRITRTVRSLIRQANRQIKNGCRFTDVPGVTFLYFDHVDAPDDRDIISALYGDLVYVAPRDHWESGELTLSGNGAWNARKNTSTSAVCVLRPRQAALVVHNRWAGHRIPAGTLGGINYEMNDQGDIELLD